MWYAPVFPLFSIFWELNDIERGKFFLRPHFCLFSVCTLLGFALSKVREIRKWKHFGFKCNFPVIKRPRQWGCASMNLSFCFLSKLPSLSVKEWVPKKESSLLIEKILFIRSLYNYYVSQIWRALLHQPCEMAHGGGMGVEFLELFFFFISICWFSVIW